MRGIERVRQALRKPEQTVLNAKLPSDKNDLVNYFEPIFRELHRQQKLNVVDPTQQLHFASLYGLVRIHAAQIKYKLEWAQSNVGYVRSFINTNESQIYHQALLAFLKEFESDFQKYRSSDAAKKYIVAQKTQANNYFNTSHRLEFSFGPEMVNEKGEAAYRPVASIAQLQKRIFAVTYFDMFSEEANAKLLNNGSSAIVTTAATALLVGPALPFAVAGGIYYTWCASETKESLEDHELSNELNNWRRELRDILSKPSDSQATLQRLGIQTESAHRNELASLHL